MAAGADLTKVHILESVILANGFEALPSLRADIDAITAAAVRLGDCRLIVIDPVSAYLEGSRRQSQCRLARRAHAPQDAGRAAGCRRGAGQSSHQRGLGQRQASGRWARSPMSEPAAPTICSSPIPTTRPAGAS